MTIRKIVLCADDYAMNEGVSRGILALADQGRISATSAMTNTPGWAAQAGDLARFDGRIGLGLHLNLTWGEPLGPLPTLAPEGRFPELPAVVGAALSGRLQMSEIADEIGRQLVAFREGLGRDPDFVDGHQHVHALPGLRGALLGVLRARNLTGRLWLRDPADRPGTIVLRRVAAGKALAVAALSAGFGARARAAGFGTNRGFSGFSPFDPARDLDRDFDAFLQAAGPAHLVMCHPGDVKEGAGLDAVVEARRRELDYLSSPAFGRLLANRRLELVPAPA